MNDDDGRGANLPHNLYCTIALATPLSSMQYYFTV